MMQQQMQPGVSPLMQQPSPQQQQQMVAGNPVQQPPQGQQHQPTAQQKDDKADNITKVKSLLAPLRESLFLALRAAAFTLQQNTLADSLKKDTVGSTAMRFDKHLEDFFAHCDQIELNLKTAIQCMQQISSAQHYLPRLEPYMQEMAAAGHLPYQSYLNTARVHVQSAKDIHDTLISAAQNISQAD